MSGFKKRFREFWAYFRLSKYGNSAEAKADVAFYIITVACLMFISFQLSAVSEVFVLELFPVMVIAVCLSIGIATRNKTLLINVAPYSPKQRIAFNLLSILIWAFLSCLVIFLISLVFVSVVALIAYLAAGENIFTPTEDEFSTLSAYGNGMKALCYAFFTFCTAALSHLNDVKKRNIATGVFFAAAIIISTVSNTIIGNILSDGAFKVYVFGDLFGWTEKLAHPWVPILIAAVLTAFALASAIYFIIKRHKSGKF